MTNQLSTNRRCSVRQISDGKLKVGDKLPSEKILAEQFKAIRPSAREAVNTQK